MLHAISDWDNAYANGVNIPRGDDWPAAWEQPATVYRKKIAEEGRARFGEAYGEGDRHRFDVFLPRGEPKGLVVYVHGGYWMRFDNSIWSHLANGPVERGFASRDAVAVAFAILKPMTREQRAMQFEPLFVSRGILTPDQIDDVDISQYLPKAAE